MKKKKTQPSKRGIYPEFGDLNVEEWVQLTEEALYVDPSLLGLAWRDEDLYTRFIRLINGLAANTRAQERFGQAVSLVFEGAQPLEGKAEAIYTLLQLIGYLTPIQAKRIVRRRVLEERFRQLQFGAMNLHCFALAVAGEYDVDEELANYIRRFNEEPLEFRYRLLSLRLLARKDPSEAYGFLPRIISELEPGVRMTQLFRELRGISITRDHASLFRWYRKTSSSILKVDKFDLFTEMLAQKLFPLEALQKVSNDPYERLFAYYLHAPRLRPEQMKELYELRSGSTAEFYSELLEVLAHAYAETGARVDDPAALENIRVWKKDAPSQDIITNKNGRINADRKLDEAFLVVMEQLATERYKRRYAF